MSGDFKKEEKKKEEKKIFPSEKEKEGKECPNCSAVNELEAKFCAECGYNFEGVKNCPKCSAKIISPNADICKLCGEWLLEGKCKFCYADIEEGATYCAECGNLLREIVCPKCGQLSSFDFCPNCGTPLTPKAEEVYNKMKNEMREAKISILFKNITYTVEEKEEVKSHEEELLKMKKYIEKVENKKKKKKTFTPLFSDKQKADIKEMDKKTEEEIKRQEEEKRKREEAERKKHEEIKKKLAEMNGRCGGTIFVSGEEATITISDDNCVLDDAFWLYVNDKKIGYVNHPQGGFTSYNVNLNKGINKVELKFDYPNGCGTGASFKLNEFKRNFGGSVNHLWMVVVVNE